MAAEQPDASLADIAAEIPSATPDLVEHVLEEYGDPADGGSTESAEATPDPGTMEGSRDTSVDGDAGIDGDALDDGTEEGDDADGTVETEESDGTDGTVETEESDDADNGGDDAGGADADTVDEGDGADDRPDAVSEDGADHDEPATSEYPDADSLTAKLRRTLEAIRDSPEATQGELAADLDVTAPTISNHVNSLPGFEWSQREAFVDAVLPGSTRSTDMDTATTNTGADVEPTDELAELTERLDALEAKVAAEEEEDDIAGARPAAALADPELLHKVVHACMESDAITEDEELRILEALLPTSAPEA